MKKWGTYSGLKDKNPFLFFALASGIAAAFAAMASNIFDVVKTRWQTRIEHTHLSSLIKTMWKTEGKWRAFFQGSLARVLWAVPNVIITFTLYELFKTL